MTIPSVPAPTSPQPRQSQGMDINDVANALKQQDDRKREQLSRYSISINPQSLVKNNPTTYGPYYFNTKLTETPYVAFGQARTDPTRAPLIVQPYIDKWISSSGGITGYYLGVFALTKVPAGLTQHTVILFASIRATSYKINQNAVNQAWESSYDHNWPSHLQIDDGDLEQPY